MLHVGHVNIRSLMTHFDDLKDFITRQNFDVYAISETWLNSNISCNNFHIQNYNLLRNDRLVGRGGGAGFFVKSNLSNNVVILNDISINNIHLEQYWIKMSLGKIKLAIGVIYRPPTGSCIEFIDCLESSISSIFTEVDHIICVGDININLFTIHNNSVKLFSALLDEFDLFQIIAEPTRITAHSETLIDVIITSSSNICSEIQVADMHHVTDHRSVSCKFDLAYKSHCEPQVIHYRDFRNVDINCLIQKLYSFDWHYFYISEDVNDKLYLFNHAVLTVLNEYVPFKTLQIRYKPSPWITDVIKIMIKFRNNAFSQYKRTKTIAHWNYYKMLRNLTTEAIRKEKKAYFEFKLKNSNGNNIWKSIKEFNINKMPDRKIPDSLCNVNLLNNHFINSIPSSLPDISLLEFYKSHRLFNNASYFSFSLVTESEVCKIFNSLKSNSTGSDDLNLNMLKFIFPDIVMQVTHLINECLLKNVVPDVWKQAVVKPIAKCKNPSSFNDIRPISILPTLSKILEKVVHSQIVRYLNDLNILPNIQSGFRKGYSTTTALQHIIDEIVTDIDAKRMVLLALLDFSKAFDTLNHDLLIAKLHYVGFSDDSLHFIRSYLSNRCQLVDIKNIKSNNVSLNKGVPQGSILGPLLFSIYVFDLCKCIKFCKIHMYADDTQVYLSFNPNDVDNAVHNMNKDIEAIAKYSSDHCLKLNESKSTVMLLGNEKTRNELLLRKAINISVNNIDINVSESCRNLGLILDHKLRFTAYVSLLIKKAFLALKNLYMNRFILSKQNRVILSSSLVLSIFNYCDTIYGPHITLYDANRIQKVQNCCIRFIFGLARREHITPYLNTLGWLNMSETRTLHAACLAHRVILNKFPIYLYSKLTVRIQHRQCNLRNNFSYHIPSHKSALFKRTFSYVCPVILNKIPSSLLGLQSASFVKNLKSLMLSRQISLL